MKTLAEMGLLKGQTEKISITEFRKRPGEVLAQVETGKEFEISRNGKVIAKIAQPEPNAFQLGVEARRLE